MGLSQSPFSKESRQRPYECLISTIKKLPWQRSDCITVQQRHAVFDATVKLLLLLRRCIAESRDPLNLNVQLEKRLVNAAMRCPGFNNIQKDGIAYIMGMSEMDQRSFGQPRFAHQWTHLYALVARPGIPLDVIEVSRARTPRGERDEFFLQRVLEADGRE